MNNKAVSMIIAVVLLIMISIVAASSAFYWMTKVQGNIQAGTESSHSELTDQVTGELKIKSFEHDSSLNTVEVIMENTGTRELKDLGDSGDLLTISSNIYSCTINLNSTNELNSTSTVCDICPFNLGVGAVESLTLNFTYTDCGNLRKGQQYNAYFGLGDARAYTTFTSDIIH